MRIGSIVSIQTIVICISLFLSVFISSSIAGVTGAYTVSGTTATLSDTTITTSVTNQSGVLVTASGNLTLTNSQITTSSATTSTDSANFYGQAAAVLAQAGSTITISDCNVKTTGKGANGVFATGQNALITLTNDTIYCENAVAHGIDATVGAKMVCKNVVITTKGNGASGAIATDRGSGTIELTQVTATTYGTGSPTIYSTGDITGTDCILYSDTSSGVVIEGANSVKLTNSSLAGGINGVHMHMSTSGDTYGTTPAFKMTGGSLTCKHGALLHATNVNAQCTLSNVSTTVPTDTLIYADSAKYGGGILNLVAINQLLSGIIWADKYSAVNVTLTESSSLTGSINTAKTANSASISLDSTSTWTVTAESHVTSMTNAGISGTTAPNITGNGNTVFYNSDSSSSLGGKTYTLVNGGYLVPEGTILSVNTPVLHIDQSQSTCIKTSSGRIILDGQIGNKGTQINIYDLQGKFLCGKTITKNIADIRNDFGISQGTYIIKASKIK